MRLPLRSPARRALNSPLHRRPISSTLLDASSMLTPAVLCGPHHLHLSTREPAPSHEHRQHLGIPWSREFSGHLLALLLLRRRSRCKRDQIQRARIQFIRGDSTGAVATAVPSPSILIAAAVNWRFHFVSPPPRLRPIVLIPDSALSVASLAMVIMELIKSRRAGISSAKAGTVPTTNTMNGTTSSHLEARTMKPATAEVKSG
ncbi:hypothetical protein MRB53_041907 [Persea americana]|nr:hypothetical protein MRB53_041907 [Persea americana]